jgi:uncharacterized protein
MDIAGYSIAILIGFLLGLLGGGGSILTVPVLVYLFGTDAVLATGYSLFIVGFTSLVGGIKAFINKQIDFRAVSLFGIPSILTIFVSRHFILPAIPDEIFTVGDTVIDKGTLLMLVFAFLMLLTSISMLRNSKVDRPAVGPDEPVPQNKLLGLLIPGLIVGLTTGLLGAGGGFLIVPALVLMIRIPMKVAVGTSLLIIAINSLFGVVFSVGHYHFNWELVLIFTALAVVGVFAGSYLSSKMNSRKLKVLFGWFVLVMGIVIIVRELVFE